MRRILVVDNSAAQLRLVGEHLVRHGYAAEQAIDGMEALERILKSPPDAVLLDLVMPRIDGARVLRYVRDHPRLKALPVVVTTGIVEGAQERMKELGADAYVVKGPPETFLANVLQALDRLLGPAPGGPPSLLGAEKVTGRQLVAELLETKKALEGILEHLAEGVLKTDAEERVMYANPEAARILGRSESELFGSRLRDLLPPSGEVHGMLERVGASGQPAHDLLTVRSGERTTKILASNLPEEGRAGGLLVVLEDVTEREALHRALEDKVEEIGRAQRRLVETEKLAATSKLIATLAHEIKNPLNAMNLSLANLDVVLEAAPSIEEARRGVPEHVGIVKAGIRRIGEMVDRLMGFARPQEVWLVTKEIHGVLREGLRNLAEQARSQKVRLEEEFADGLPPLRMEESELYRAFYNLFLNALEAMPDGGTLKVRTACAGDALVVSVSDTGPGIPPSDHQKIFDLFYTTKPRGMGLGLSQVFRTVESLGGRIAVESAPKAGTTFSLTFPLEHAPRTP